MKKSRMTALLLLAAMTISDFVHVQVIPGAAYAAEDAVYQSEINDFADEKQDITEDDKAAGESLLPAGCGDDETDDMYWGYVEPEDGETVDVVHYGGTTGSGFVSGEECVLGGADEEALPGYYITRNLPPLRNQAISGPCWAFGMNATAEIYALMHEDMRDDYNIIGYVDSEGKYVEGSQVSADAVNVIYDVDLSEAHSCYFVYNTPMDPLGGFKGDKNGFKTAGKDCFSMGGNFLYARNVFMGWIGPAAESKVPYSNRSDIVRNGLDEELAFDDVYHMTAHYMVNIVENPELVKKAIMERGAANASIYYSTTYYNSSTNGYWCYNKYSTNHAITLVGWDDSYPASNFKMGKDDSGNDAYPSKDGAWIARNSHTENTPFSMSRQGYFYLSYEDTSLLYNRNKDTGRPAYFYDYAFADDNEYCYQYDGGMVSTGLKYTGSIQGANVFRAKADEDGEFIDSIAFATETTNQDYKVYIYTDVKENAKNPEDGLMAWGQAVAGGTAQYAGYYKVKLDKPVYVMPDDRFSVVVVLEKNEDAPEGEKAGIAAEYNSPDNSTAKVAAWSSYDSVCGIGEGESYIYVEDQWYDLEEFLKDDSGAYNAGRSGGNVRIKAYTDGAVSDNEIGVQTVIFEDGEIGLTEGETYQLEYKIYPTNATEKGLVFQSSDDGVVSVDEDGKVTAVSTGTADIKVGTVSAGGFIGEIKVSVKKGSSSGSDKEDESSSAKGDESSSAKGDESSSAKGDASSSAKGDESSSAKGDASSSAKGDASSSAKGDESSSAKGDESSSAKGDASSSAKGDASSSAKGDESSSAKGDESSSAKGDESSSAKGDASSSAKGGASSSSKEEGSGSDKGDSGSSDKNGSESTKDNGSSSAIQSVTVLDNIVVKQKIDIMPCVKGSYRKYKVLPKGYAKVSKSGILTAKKPGDITVYACNKTGRSWTETEIVRMKIEKPVILSKRITSVVPGETINGSDNIAGSITKPTLWSSSKPQVAGIDEKTGLITIGNQKGTTLITAYYGEGSMAARLRFRVKNDFSQL